jgi:3-phosphoshikimate 1-carboxyvinyltransferase
LISVISNSRNIICEIPLTASKSITNRLLIMEALCKKPFQLSNISASSDTIILQKALSETGTTIDVRDAGTAFRFLTSYFSLIRGKKILTGSERMKNRPVSELVHALNQLGAEIEYTGLTGYPPLAITGGNMHGAEVEINGSRSSQFISALLMIAPCLKDGLTLRLTGELVSRPYFLMTIELMKACGINVIQHENQIIISQQEYHPVTIHIENDWSAASYWYEIAVFSDHSEIILQNLSSNSLQGDSRIADLANIFGINTSFENGNAVLSKIRTAEPLTYFEYDFTDCPDLVMTMAAICTGKKVRSVFNGISHLRLKESDRLEAMKSELEKFGVFILLSDQSMIIEPSGERQHNIAVDTHNDHRLAMSLIPLAMLTGHLTMSNYQVVKKSYPEFFDQLLISKGFIFQSV